MKLALKNKILIGVSAFLMAICCVLGITSMQKASAQSEEIKLEIISNNVSNDDATYVLYAVYSDGFDKTENQITMLFWTEAQENYLKGDEDYVSASKGYATVKGQACEIFYSEGLAAKRMTDDLYCRAYAQVDGRDYYSDVVKYSVLEYVHERKESGECTDKQIKMYNAMLSYGAAAQEVYEYKLNRLANATYYKVCVTNGYLEDGFTLGRYQTGDTVTVCASEAPAGQEFAYWVNEHGEKVSRDAEYQVEVETENCILTATYKEIGEEDDISVEELVDFVVEVESGKDPVVLQLTDPQLCSWGNLQTYCYDYLQDTVEATAPDLILMTGDLIYGRYDPSGTLLQGLIAFMESLQIPWAPVFGNHDNESLMGVDWQCAQLENAEYCLFKQGDVTGNGNYSVGLKQNNEIIRVFYMLDSNGCSKPMCNSDGVQTTPAAGTNLVKTSAGFAQDQINWYTEEINAIHAVNAEVEISFAYHIQQAIFQKAFEKYNEFDNTAASGSNSALENPLNIDTLKTAEATDFGYIGRRMKGAWDTDYAIFNAMKKMGVDSIFVGHEHCNSASIVYEGVRFQYGQKSSTYDRYNWVLEDGTIQGEYISAMPSGAHPLIGGTVIPISADGAIGTGYIYYSGDPFNFEADKIVDISLKNATVTVDFSGYDITQVTAVSINEISVGEFVFANGKLTFATTYFTNNAVVGDCNLKITAFRGTAPYAFVQKAVAITHVIGSVKDFDDFVKILVGYGKGKENLQSSAMYAVLSSDINYNGGNLVTNTGRTNFDTNWCGTFDGRGHVISNLTVDRGGVFGYIRGGTVKNLGLVNVTSNKLSTETGGLLCMMLTGGGTIDNCFIQGSFTNTSTTTGGALAEFGYNTMTNCITIVSGAKYAISGQETTSYSTPKNSYGISSDALYAYRTVATDTVLFKTMAAFVAKHSTIPTGFNSFWKITNGQVTFGSYTTNID